MTSGFQLAFLLSLTGGLLISGTWSAAINACPTGWTTLGSRCFLAKDCPKAVAEAELACVSLGGNLASIHSLAENNLVRKLIHTQTGSNPQFWIGLVDVLKEGKWMWTDGSVVDYTNWHSEEPNNAGGKEDCVIIRGPTWNDAKCTKKKVFVCAREGGYQ